MQRLYATLFLIIMSGVTDTLWPEFPVVNIELFYSKPHNPVGKPKLDCRAGHISLGAFECFHDHLFFYCIKFLLQGSGIWRSTRFCSLECWR